MHRWDENMGGWLSCRYQFLCQSRAPVLASAIIPFEPVPKHVFTVRSSETIPSFPTSTMALSRCLNVLPARMGTCDRDNPAARSH